MDFSVSGHFGDFDIENGDLRMISSRSEILKNIIISRIKNNAGDSYVQFGANLISLIGEPVNQVLVEKIKNKIINALTLDGLIKKTELTIIAVRNLNSVAVRILVSQGLVAGNSDLLTINFTFTNDAGVSGV